ncbi:putative Curli production assembly/transport component CsgG [Candidatus Sulfopaludibacter sp. SbA4]|nr:putative Curli production assembly/transport component CsgG [Candidatus Sulfopaludibacter sp. SbA4]
MPFSRNLRDVFHFCLPLTLIPMAALGQAKRVAVYDFDYKAVRGDVVQVYGSDKDVGAQVAARIISKLVNASGQQFEVIDRNQIDNLMKEQNLKFSDRFDPRDAPRLGKLLNVDAIVTGTVDAIAGEVQNNRVGVGAIGLGKVQSVAAVTVSVRVISTETGQIFLADQVNNQQKHSLGSGAKVKGNGGEGGTITMHPAAMAANLAVQGAADDIAKEMISKAAALPSRRGGTTTAVAKRVAPAPSSGGDSAPASSPPPTRLPDATPLQVGKVEGNKVYVTAGENAGLKSGDYLEVRHVTGSMKDPQGNDIEMDERVETVQLTDVQDRFAVGRTTSGGNSAAKVGDKLKHTKAPAPKKSAPAAPGLPSPVQRKQ